MENTSAKNNKYSILTRGYFYLGVFAIFGMICLNNFTTLQVPALPFLMVLFIVAIFCDRTEIFALIACCVPFSVGFQYKFGILICLAVYLVKYFKDIKFRWPVIISFAVLIVWELLHVVIGGEPFYAFLRSVCELILIFFIAIISLKYVDYVFIIRVFAVACFGIMVILFIEQLSQNDFVFEDIFYRKFRFGQNYEAKDEFGLVFNPNMLGFICSFCISVILQLIISKKANVLDFSLLIPFVFFGVMTMSRAFLLCLAVIILMFLFAGKISVKKKLIRAGIVAGALAVIAFLVFLLMPSVVEKFIGRFETDDISNGRIDLFVFYTKHIFSSFKNAMFGIGLQNVGGKLQTLYPDAYEVCHHGLQQIVIAWGIPGFIVFAIFTYYIIRNSLKKVKFSILNFMPMLLILVDIQLSQFISDGKVLIMFAISLLSINFNFELKEPVAEPENYPNLFVVLYKAIKYPQKLLKVFIKSNFSKILSDELFLKLVYFVKFNKKLDLKNPKTFNEKLQWLKLHDRRPLYTVMVDKYDVKEYVADKIGEEYIIPTLGVWNNPDDIDFNKLPNKFVLKCTHNSGGLVICKDKKTLDIKSVKAKFKKALEYEYFYLSREWPYKNVQPRIIAEKYIENGEKIGESDALIVYKVMCFNGNPKIIQVIQGDKTQNETIDYFDVDWNLLELKQNYENSSIHLEKPTNLNEMLSLTKKLAGKKPFIRVDWYISKGKLKFSEFTFYSDAGFAKFEPESWDETLGSYINLEKVKVNNGK